MMVIECADLQRLVSGFSLVRACDKLQSGALRISTPFFYPNTSNIDVFIEPPSNLFAGYTISDFGQTTDFLLQLNLPPWGTKKRQRVVQQVCRLLRVELSEGRIRTEVVLNTDTLQAAVPGDQHGPAITDAILRVGQACLRVADLCFTKSLRAPSLYQEEVEEFLSDRDFSYESDVTLLGIYGRSLPFDFRVQGTTKQSLMQTLSTGHSSVSHNMATDAFTKWHDLEPQERNRHQCLTVFDSTRDVFRDDDLNRLREYSFVFAFPADEQQIAETLRNAA